MAGDLVPIDEVFPVSIIAPAADLAQRIAKTEFVPSALRNRPEAVLACMLAGHEVGIGPMQALSKIHIIEGRPAMAAELMRALVQREGHEIWFEESSSARVTLCGRRRESDHVSKVTWTLDDAKRADLSGKKNWRQYPRQMLAARATGELCRMVFADVLGGVSYTPEELDDGVLEVESEEVPPDDAGGEQKTTHTRKASASKKAAAKRSAPPAAPGPQAQPPEPPLPGEDEPAASSGSSTSDEAPEEAQSDPTVLERSKSIAIACQRAGLDDEGRHRLIQVVTNGRVGSSKLVTVEEGIEVLQAAHEIRNGRLSLVESESGWALVKVEDATGGGDETAPEASDPDAVKPIAEWGDEDRWSGDQWRAFFAQRGVDSAAAFKAAQKLAIDFDEEQPASIDELRGRTRLCQLLRGWVEEQSEEAGS